VLLELYFVIWRNEGTSVQEFLAVASALADANRLRLLMSLHGREVCVCNLVEFIGLADSTVSKHMSILREAGLVVSRKRGRWVYYRLAGEDASPLVRKALDVARELLAADGAIMADASHMAELLMRNDGTACQPDSARCAEKADVALETE
jgi:ArsR family transcriptional regulator, arsenate/arsenite/antimonite-responsive transcriptional repressor